VGEVGGILCNPVDMSQAQFQSLATLFQAIDLVAEDPVIDLILIQEDVDILLSAFSWREAKEINEFFIELGSRHNKLAVVVLPVGSAEPERLQIEQQLLLASVPVFPTIQCAARAMSRADDYLCSQQALASDETPPFLGKPTNPHNANLGC